MMKKKILPCPTFPCRVLRTDWLVRLLARFLFMRVISLLQSFVVYLGLNLIFCRMILKKAKRYLCQSPYSCIERRGLLMRFIYIMLMMTWKVFIRNTQNLCSPFHWSWVALKKILGSILFRYCYKNPFKIWTVQIQKLKYKGVVCTGNSNCIVEKTIFINL